MAHSTSSTPPLDTRSLITTYANFFRASGSADELILDFGVDGHHQSANGPEPIVLSHRLVLSWNNAQRLLHMLHDLTQHHIQTRTSSVGNRPPTTPPQNVD